MSQEATSDALSSNMATLAVSDVGSSASSSDAPVQTVAKKAAPWKLICDAIDKLDVHNPDISIFFSLFFAIFGHYVDMVEQMNIDQVVRFLQTYWRDTTLNFHKFLKMTLVDSSWPAKELARLTTLMYPRKRDADTLDLTEEIDEKKEIVNIMKAIDCVLRALSVHEPYIRKQDWEKLITSWWGDLEDPDQTLRPSDPGYITWCNPAVWMKDWKNGVPDDDQPPGAIEDVWDLLGDLPGAQAQCWDNISQTFLLAKLLQNLSPKGWTCVMDVVRKLITAIRSNPKVDKKFLESKITELMNAAVEDMETTEKTLILDCLQDTFLTLSMKMERMFLDFFAGIPDFVKTLVDRKLQERDPNLSCDSFIDTTRHNLSLVRVFFQHARVHTLSTEALKNAIIGDLAFSRKVDINVSKVVESAKEVAMMANAEPTSSSNISAIGAVSQ